MGTLGEYLREARVAKEMELRDAAQQTRISLQYLKALEEEDFTKLPGEVFVRGFLKNYSRFLDLDESEVMKRYSELRSPSSAVSPVNKEIPRYLEEAESPPPGKETPLEPFIWGAVIILALIAFLFVSFPSTQLKKNLQTPGPISPALQSEGAGTTTATVIDKKFPATKMYLKIIAVEDTWLLIRTDGSPQKKAVLKQGDSLIWSADERFVLSYGHVGALKLLLNGEELSVSGEPDMPVRDLIVARNGIVRQPRMSEEVPVKHHPAPVAEPKPTPTSVPKAKPEAKPKPAAESAQTRTVETPPIEAPTKPAPLSPSPVQTRPIGTANP